ncbi:hydrolytic protein [uncultured Streptomyces sp.]|uniref:COG1470 family protein n=1 Tax=uncultured Streptomyces sp. TaxID=174707 RepID=UPI00260572ED|nr:hydrolytic protein [uncultured Streptomyces sp.]
MTTHAELELPTVTVSPGGTATTTLTVRNDGDIVEAYTLEVVGDCAPWSTVEPARVSLYPGTSETVTILFAPPRSHEVAAGEIPLAVRVLPAEHPDSVVVPEGTVLVEPFHELRAELDPRRRRGWLRARFRVAVQNRGNTAVDVALTGRQDGQDLRLVFAPDHRRLEPGESAETRLKVRALKPIWFGPPAGWPFEVLVAEDGERESEEERPLSDSVLPGEFAQLPIFPRWLLIVLAALLALLIAWFALVRPAVRSTAKEAGTEAAQEEAARVSPPDGAAPGAESPTGGQEAGPGASAAPGGGTGGGAGAGTGTVTGPGGVGGTQQSSATIDVQTGAGAQKEGTYKVPAGKVFGVTDIVVANFQGDEGVVTISFGERKITTIALETFRNQDYHWVTPIQIPENATVTAAVTCSKPGTPATGTQATGCHQILNVSGVLSDIQR